MDLQSSQNTGGSQNAFSFRERHAHRHDVIERIVISAGGVLMSLLGLRFAFALLGANPANGFANFVYTFTAPFVSPFYNLFSYDHPTVGVSTFQGYTLVAMAVYALVASVLAKVVSITRYS